eukprot:TRINITY_DN18784_c0_g2_i1.p1 TRINITY_DN18784_c0_g2~~TRINITY_DN18784_c0_g2_i1.p1  ORF type:complete len:158 (+),score=40.92 TRINITY_DN18784_c0_g2_i1:432-905(+)
MAAERLGVDKERFCVLVKGLVSESVDSSVLVRGDGKSGVEIDEKTPISLNHSFSSEKKEVVLVKKLWRRVAKKTREAATSEFSDEAIIAKERIVKLRCRIMKVVKMFKPVSLEKLIAEVLGMTKEFKSDEEQVKTELNHLLDYEHIQEADNFYIPAP